MEAIRVNGVEIPEAAVLAAMRHHPARDRGAAIAQAAQALVVDELLRQRATALGLDRVADDALDALIASEVALPEPDEASCRRYYEANIRSFRSPTLYEARHILIAAPAD